MEKKLSLSHRIGLVNFSVQLSHDRSEVEAIYFKLKKGRVAESKEIGPHGEAIIDFDENGSVLGIEMLDPGSVTVKLFNKIKKDYKIEELEGVNISRLQEAFT